MRRAPLTLTTLTAAAALTACTVTYLEDLYVEWSIEGSTSESLCDTYGIDTWQVTADGPDYVTATVLCGLWDTGATFDNLAEGRYLVTVDAVDGGGSVLASISSQTRLDHADGPVDLSFDFVASDFGPVEYCGDGTCNGPETCSDCPEDCGGCDNSTINIYWNINGTVDGTDTGASWDTCDEVSAASVVVTVDGVEQTVDCAAGGSMSKAISVTEGNHTLSAVLVDSTGAPVTTEAPEATISASPSQPGTYIAEFYYDAFFDPIGSDTLGDFLFNTSYEDGLSCNETSPAVVNQVTLIELDGTPLNPAPEVCGPDQSCEAADGASFGKCYTPDETQEIRDVLWGEYKLQLQGTLNSTAGFEICWETLNPNDNSSFMDILVGAGRDNPVVPFDLERISTSGACAP